MMRQRSARGKACGVFRPALILVAMAVSLAGCRSGSDRAPSDEATLMRLTSGYAEIVIQAAKVPGYWANRVGDGEKFFLYTLDRSYRKGDVILVDGTFGTAEVAVFDDETRVYQGGARTNIFVVQRAAKAAPAKEGPAAAGKASP